MSEHTETSATVLLTVGAACARLSIGRSKLYELFNAGAIKRRSIGRAVRVLAADLDRFAESLGEQDGAA